MTLGRLSRAMAITMAGIVLSQPESVTRPSSRWPRVTSSTESAIQSRLISEAFMPSVPMAMPSVTEIVLNSIGVPPLARMPSATFWVSLRWLELQGVSSMQQWATPTSGRARSSSVKPTARKYERAAARSGPSSRTRLLWRGSNGMETPPYEARFEERPGFAGGAPSRQWGVWGAISGPLIYRLIALCTQLLTTSIRWLCQGSGSRPLVRYANDTPDSGSAQQ